ncbi:MAG: glycosyltransferase family 4 protein [Desulfovermiculus sp.]
MQKPIVIFAANRGYALTSSRTLLIRHFLSSGWEVVLATADDKESRSLCEMGANLEPVVFNRGGFSPVTDIKAYRRLLAIYKKWRPALVQHFHAKPVILGPLAARRTLGNVVRVVNAITGLGHAFIVGGLTSRLAGMGYGLARPRTDAIIFQNRDDRALFVHRGWVDAEKARLIPGSGVDVERFAVTDRDERDGSSPVVVMLGRLLGQKGVPEFVEVAKRIQAKWPGARFILAGEEDPVHPDAVTAKRVREQKSVKYLGRLTDVRPLLAQADLLLFPSYYREGLPRGILEAAASGLPTIAFDVPGVRDAVRDGETGYLVSYPDIEALTQRVQELIEDSQQRLHMGRAARKMVEKEFDIRVVQARYLDVYRELGVEI